MAKRGHGVYWVTYDGIVVDIEMPYGVKINADKGDVRCQNAICAMFREAARARGDEPKHRFEYSRLLIQERHDIQSKEPANPAIGEEGSLFD